MERPVLLAVLCPPTVEPIKVRRIGHENLLADRRIGRPNRKLIEQSAVVDLKQRCDIGRLLSGRRHRIGVGPVGSRARSGIARDKREHAEPKVTSYDLENQN